MFEEAEPTWTDGPLILIGRAVRSRRHDLGWSQRELGAVIGLSQSTISRLEHGRTPTLKLKRFARLVVLLRWVGTEDERRRALATRDRPAWWDSEERRRRRTCDASLGAP
jgi:transcriptional regulator with XRE-family HTH domain